ncbi:D-alanyl-lipoteichoic acid biosynthesis protein DltD [Desulfosporosinus fructosivorans]|nr:D-alanyl-lipoteichoic acid biosynthesis protein DltD [Desulfosporosinus fructosivorans]
MNFRIIIGRIVGFASTTMRRCNSTFSAMVFAGCLFVVTIYGFGYVSSIGIENIYLRPEIVAAMGVNPTFDTFQGSILQKMAFRDPNILPLYGSSEMSYIRDFQPARIFTPETGFTPFLVGKGGNQTLIHVLNLAALGEEARGRKLAIFLSPQWFGLGGIPQLTFQGNFSALHAYEMLRDPRLSSELKQEIAKRLLQFPGAYKDFPFLEKMLADLVQPDWSSKMTRIIWAFPTQMEYSALTFQDAYKTIMNVNKPPLNTVSQHAGSSKIPKDSTSRGLAINKTQTLIQGETSEYLRLDWAKLRTEAIEEGKKSSNNNPFGMDNRFYLEQIAPKLQEQKDSDKNAKLFPSPEYEDLILLMKVMKEKGVKPLFVILPMNGRWSDYTGFPRTERQACYKLLAQMVQAEDFQLSDFTAHENDDYYLRDPWHLAWKGWIDVNEALDQFYRE